MDSTDFDNVKAEKANAMKKYQRLQKLANFFRIFEVIVALIMLSWVSTRLPVVLRISEKYFRQLCVVIVSPRFVFFVGNAIILTLFAKSGSFSGEDSGGSSSNAEADLYNEFVEKTETGRSRVEEEISLPKEEEETVYEDKKTVYEENNTVPAHDHTNTPTPTPTVTFRCAAEPIKVPVTEAPKVYRRSRSARSNRDLVNEKSKRELRRSETAKYRKSDASREDVVGASDSDAFMSNEEFQRKIEAFIAKQVRFHRQESMAIVLQ